MSHEEEFNAYWIIVNFGLTMEVDVSKHQQLSKIVVNQNDEMAQKKEWEIEKCLSQRIKHDGIIHIHCSCCNDLWSLDDAYGTKRQSLVLGD